MTASTTIVAETQSKKTTTSAQAATQMFAVGVSVIGVMAFVAMAVAGFLCLRSRKKQNRPSVADPV